MSDRVLTVGVIAILLVTGLASVPAGTAASADVEISGVEVAPASPIVGETVTMTVDVTLPENVTGSGTVTDVYVRGEAGTDIDRVSDPGSIDAGETMPVPLTATFDEAGTKRLAVTAVVNVDGEYESVTTATVVTVHERGEVLVAMPDLDPVAGSTVSFDVRVANGGTDPITSVQLDLDSNATLDDSRRVTAAIDGQTNREFTVEATFPETGDYNLDATLSYRTAGGERRTVTRTTVVEAVAERDSEGLAGDIELTELQTSGGNLVTIEGNAANVGGESVRSVLMRIKDTDTVTPREGSGEYFVGTVNASTFETFELVGTADGSPPEAVPIVVEYITDGQRRETTFTVEIGDSGGRPAMGDDGADGPAERSPDRVDQRAPPTDDRSGGLLAALPIVPIGIVALLIVGVTGYLVRSRR